jgi:protein required for attachment to host cells
MRGPYTWPPTVDVGALAPVFPQEFTMQQQIPEGTLIVVADGGSARVFTNIGSGHTLQLKQQDALKLQDISAQGVSGQGPSGSMPQDTSIAQMNEATFAKQLAGQLNEDALNNRYAHLVLIADPQTLGRIRPQLHKEVQARLLTDIAKDLTNAPLEDIQRALESSR